MKRLNQITLSSDKSRVTVGLGNVRAMLPKHCSHVNRLYANNGTVRSGPMSIMHWMAQEEVSTEVESLAPALVASPLEEAIRGLRINMVWEALDCRQVHGTDRYIQA